MNTEQERAELLPCPFCGGAPKIVERDVEPQGDPWYGHKFEKFVECECGACLFDETFHEGFYSDGKAVEAWNRRAALQSQDREGDDLKEVGKQAVRWAPSSAYWSAELTRLFGPDAREGINVLEARLRDFEVDALRWRYMRRKLCLTGNGNGTCAMYAINLPEAINGWPEPGQVAEFCEAAIDHARRAEGGNHANS